jgi:hypothetical protein
MTTQYIHHLHVVVRSQAKAAALSAAAFAQFPEIGPNNVGTPLVDASGPDDDEVIAWLFSAPVKQAYIDWLAAIGYSASDAVDPDVTWARTDRDGTVRKRSGDENPEPIVLDCDGFLAENRYKLRRVSVEI